MCGIIGIIEPNDSNINYIINGMTYLQHRGQDSTGIALFNKDGKIHIKKDIGLVSNVFSKEQPDFLHNMSIGHVRYSTQGNICSSEAQPFYVNFPYGMTIVHNGNITNTNELKEYIKNKRHIQTDSDSELLLNVIAEEIHQQSQIYNIPECLFHAVKNIMNLQVRGSYSVILAISGIGLLIFRDPYGIRPLCFGKSKDDGYMFTSESVALTGTPYEYFRDVYPSECIFITNQSKYYSKIIKQTHKTMPCLFEYIYFARPDSLIDGISVYKARERMGILLGNKIRNNYKDYIHFDVVIPVPDTSRTFAICVAEVLKIPYRDAFIKNKYIARTFITSNNENKKARSKMVKMKLNTIKEELQNKNIIIVDDSIVRGTTSKEIVKLVKESGAKSVWFASASPPIRYVNRFGIDIKKQEELIAFQRTEEEIANELGCENVIYNDLDVIYDDLKSMQNSHVNGFEVSCFTGKELTII